jgi:UDP-N-acetylglucosamine/UDP-N-acetylgalactosamine diphosphorylase
MTIAEAQLLLAARQQDHVLNGIDRLSGDQQESLLAQIAALDFDAIDYMREMVAANEESAPGGETAMQPAPVLEQASLSDEQLSAYITTGEAALAANRVGVVLVAGGQGSRLGFDGPKGSYLIGALSDASLFEIHARKLLAFERRYDAEIPFYIMTSQVNDAATRAFFEQHDYFGLERSRVRFFSQGMWPALEADGKIILDAPGHIFMSPDGHGGVLSALESHGQFEDMRTRGVDTVFFFQVDNPLVEIADPAFVGMHLAASSDVSVKVCAKRDPDEGLGVVVVEGGQSRIVEYTELTDAQKQAREPDGKLHFCYGSVAIHIFSRAFMEQEASARMPLHIAHKQVPVVGAAGQVVVPTAPNAFKCEKFIFDVLPDAKTTINVEFDRALEFSPVKNAEGNDSPATTRRDMTRKFANWFEQCGYEVPRGEDGESQYRLEIDPCFALDAGDLLEQLGESFSLTSDLCLRDVESCDE